MSQDTVIIPYLLTYFLVKAKYGGVLDVTTRVSETLRYADATVPAYNGNVGERVYADATWTYHYDGHNRLTKAAYRSTGNVENFSTEYAYDRQANLTRLKKWGLYEPSTGDCALIDNLHISYDGNQAVRVEDYGEDPVFEGAGGFNAPDGVGTMTYDDNGNLTSDSGRGITRIEYNRFNLPTAIYFGDGHRQTISYDGRGVKLSVTYSTATSPVLASGTARRYKTDFVRRYGAGRVVRGDSVEMVMHPYGYFDGNGEIRYYLHDFQGNVTMVVDNEGEVLQHTRYYPYGEAIDVFATSVLANTATTADRAQPYLYGGKELERMHGLGEYDYGARRLQSHLPLWTTQDPCLEKYYSTSPYAYCAANPIRFTDPTGCEFTPELQIIINTLVDVCTKFLQNSAQDVVINIKGTEINVNKEIKNMLKELDRMGCSDQLYDVSFCNNYTSGYTMFNLDNETVVFFIPNISIGMDKNLLVDAFGIVSHELKHGFQFLNEEIDLPIYDNEHPNGFSPNDFSNYNLLDELN